jgi:hypothetical protein
MSRPKFEVTRARQLNNKLRLQEISLFGMSAQHLLGVENPQLGFSVDFKPIEWAPLAGHIAAVFPLFVDIEHTQNKHRRVLARLHVMTKIVYEKVAEFETAHLAYVEDFLALIGWMNAWPYARADIQTLSTRLGFPALVLPVLLPGQTSEVSVKQLPLPDAEGERANAQLPRPSARPKKKQFRVPRRG